MNTVQLSPVHTPNIGYGPVYFSSPNAPVIAAGDPCVLMLLGQSTSPVPQGFGYMLPSDSKASYYGSLDPSGNTFLTFVAQEATDLETAPGITLFTGLLPGGGVGFLGVNSCPYLPQGPPPPPPTPGIPYLAAQAIASVAPGGPSLPSIYPQNATNPNLTPVSFAYNVAGDTGVASIWLPECASASAAATLAQLLGGTVVAVAPPSQFTGGVIGPAPTVNGIRIGYNGQQMQAVAGEIMQTYAQLQGAGTLTLAQAEAALLACFTPAI